MTFSSRLTCTKFPTAHQLNVSHLFSSNVQCVWSLTGGWGGVKSCGASNRFSTLSCWFLIKVDVLSNSTTSLLLIPTIESRLIALTLNALPSRKSFADKVLNFARDFSLASILQRALMNYSWMFFKNSRLKYGSSSSSSSMQCVCENNRKFLLFPKRNFHREKGKVSKFFCSFLLIVLSASLQFVLIIEVAKPALRC